VRAEGRGAPGRKKLKEAARAWATGGAAVDEQNALAGLRKFGATEQQLEEARAQLEQRQRSAVFELWPENWRAWELFEVADTAWRREIAGKSIVYFGFDWPALGEIERRLPPEDPADEWLPDARQLLYQLKVLEGEALVHLNA
jgi:hypothetical protein